VSPRGFVMLPIVFHSGNMYRVLTPRKRPFFAGYAAPAKRVRRAPAAKRAGGLQRFNRRHAYGPSKKGSLAQQVASLQRVVKDILPEIKNATIDLAQTNFGTSGTIQHLTAIAQNPGENQRIGEDVTVKAICVKGQITNMITTGTLSTPAYYRFYVVKDKQQVNDTTPAISDIFSTTDPVTALPAISFSERFAFLWQSPLLQNNAVLSGNQFPVCNWSWSGTIKVGYNGTNTTDIQKNGIYFVMLTTDAGGTVDFAGSARISFTDV